MDSIDTQQLLADINAIRKAAVASDSQPVTVNIGVVSGDRINVTVSGLCRETYPELEDGTAPAPTGVFHVESGFAFAVWVITADADWSAAIVDIVDYLETESPVPA